MARIIAGLYKNTKQVVRDEQETQLFPHMTFGTVVATNDPQQMGRVRALCPAYNDDPEEETIERIPWAMYVSPFGGSISNENMTRGPEDDTTGGNVAYGMWNIPKVGATVLISCINGDPSQRVWMGCLFGQALNNTLPHGRFFYNADQQAELDVITKLEGPLSQNEDARIQPLYDNLTIAFSDGQTLARDSFEFRTRAADFSSSAVFGGHFFDTREQFLEDPAADDITVTFTAEDGTQTNIRQGYELSRIDPDRVFDLLDETIQRNFDSQTYSWTTPGFHSISMDDRVQNTRIRVRTSAGAQIILDDTNERIYVSTAEGENWFEMDYDGNVDMHCKRFNVHADDNINLTAGNQIRIFGQQGVHIHSGGEIRMDADSDVNIQSDANIRVHATSQAFLQADSSLHLKAGGSLFASAGGSVNLNAASTANIQAGSSMNLLGGSQLLVTASAVHWNGPSASSAAQASAAGEQLAFFTNRVPQHEPWARTTTAGDFTHNPKFSYNDANVGREDKTRGSNWRR